MKSRWWATIFAAVPLAAAVLVLQSCGGEGGPISSGGGGLGPSAAFLALLPAGQSGADYVGSETCGSATCHGGADGGETIFEHWEETVHFTKNVGCESCHGPGGNHAAGPTKENILTFPSSTDPVVCGQCHGPINDQWQFSQHSKLIVSPVERGITNPGSSKSSRCIACHGGDFRIQTYEKGVDVGTMPDEDMQRIAAGILNKVPHSATCATCHNPHAKTGNLTDTGEDVHLRKMTFNSDTGPIGPGTTPEEFTKFDHICAQCHNGRGPDPSDARLTASASRPNFHYSNQFNMLLGIGGVEGVGPVARNTAHANAPGQCSKCHMPDSRHTFTVSYDKGCAPCHTAADAAARTTSVKNQVLAGLFALRQRMTNWSQSALGDPDFWNYSAYVADLGKTPPNQSLVPIEVKRARHNYYYVINSGDFGVHNAPYANHLLLVANQNISALPGGPYMPSRTATPSRQQMLETIRTDRERAVRADTKEPLE